MKFRDCNEAALVSRMAASLWHLTDEDIQVFAFRYANYPFDIKALARRRFDEGYAARIDAAALHAETTRRALRVGAGFRKQGAAA